MANHSVPEPRHKLAAPAQESTLSYAELNARANRLAHRLIELGAAPERPVGILMRRSLDLFTGLVAILKAGSAYVPMDPDYPSDRLAIMAGDSKVSLALHVTAHAFLVQLKGKTCVEHCLEACMRRREFLSRAQSCMMSKGKAGVMCRPLSS